MVTEYTKIKNDILEALYSASLTGCELAICLLIIRKTYGWNKKSDKISLSQFTENLTYSKQGICKALNSLKKLNIIILVKKGLPQKIASEWLFNKQIKTWRLVNQSSHVNQGFATSKPGFLGLVNQGLHTKETIQKKLYKRKGLKEQKVLTPSQIAKEFFKEDSQLKQKAIDHISQLKNIPPVKVSQEVEKFINYWTEMNKSGTKQRWELEKTFQVQRRIATWLNRSIEFTSKSTKVENIYKNLKI